MALDLHEASVSAPSATGILELAFLDDAGAETRCRAPQRIGKKLVGLVRAENEKPTRPMLPHQILCERVGQHGARRGNMNDVHPAVVLAQPVVGRARIEEDQAPLASGICRSNERIRREVRHD